MIYTAPNDPLLKPDGDGDMIGRDPRDLTIEELAPIEQAWQGKSLGDICRQIKDPARNGGKTLAQLHEHMAEDELVAWGWNPGDGREAVPGTQAQFGEIIQAWIDTGAACPN